jgi:hypothetical protein
MKEGKKTSGSSYAGAKPTSATNSNGPRAACAAASDALWRAPRRGTPIRGSCNDVRWRLTLALKTCRRWAGRQFGPGGQQHLVGVRHAPAAMAGSLGTLVAVAVFASAIRAMEMLEMPGRRSLMSGPRFDTVRRARARVDERDRKNQPEEKTRNAHGGKAWIIATNRLPWACGTSYPPTRCGSDRAVRQPAVSYPAGDLRACAALGPTPEPFNGLSAAEESAGGRRNRGRRFAGPGHALRGTVRVRSR